MFRIKIEESGLKHVNYRGVSITVPKEVTYIATDGSGKVYGYKDKPELKTYSFQGKFISDLGSVSFEGDWRESLEHFPNEEEFNIDLCSLRGIPTNKSVEYFNILLVPALWVNYIATDEDGEIWIYEKKPEIDNDRFDGLGVSQHIATCTFKGDWKESLKKVSW